MKHRKPLVRVYPFLFLLLVATGALAGATLVTSCTDRDLYKWSSEPYRADKLTVSGTVCSDDPRQQNFPVKILFLVDSSSVVLDENNDSTGNRGKAVAEIIQNLEKKKNYEFGIIRYSGYVESMIDGGFTRDTSLLEAQTVSLQGAYLGCQSGSNCRDLEGAINLASSIITGDVLSSDPGVVSRTSYILVLFSTGGPIPAIGRCACRDFNTETDADKWSGCPWTECDANPSQGNLPSCPAAHSNNPAWTSINCPDTFSHWVLPNDPSQGIKNTPPGCKPCELCCVYPAEGRPQSCEERTLTGTVRELRSFALANGAAQFQFHTTYLPDESNQPAVSPFKPPACECAGSVDCAKEADHERSARLLIQLAFAGDGSYKQLRDEQGTPRISFEHVDLFTSRHPLLFKELIVTNSSVLSSDRGLLADSDQDGLSDQAEATLNTCPRDPDTDGDGITDAVEVKLARDPLVAEEALECLDLTSLTETMPDLCSTTVGATKEQRLYRDSDQDGLNQCEERLLGTNDSLYDSDADGIPDNVEFIAGTNYLAVDHLNDPDFDGVVNREEIRSHTDPRANDAQEQLDLAYRYEITDEGIRPVVSYTPPPTITGVDILNASAASTAGVGFLRYDAGDPNDPTKPPTLSWRDPGDMSPGTDYGPPVDISKPLQEGYKLPSFREERFITVFVRGRDQYLKSGATDQIVISTADRNCIRFRVRNITLLETLASRYARGGTYVNSRKGDNFIYLHFAEAPEDAKSGYGIFRVASQVIQYLKGPPEKRTPMVPEVVIPDERFVIRAD